MQLNELLKQHQATHLLLDDPINIYYFTQLHFSAARLLLTSDASTLFVDFRYYEKAKNSFKGKVIGGKDIDEALKAALPTDAQVAFLSDKVVVDRFKKWESFEGVKFIPAPNMVAPMRAIKSEKEIRKIKEACSIAQDGFQFLREQLEEGISEIELAKALEIFFLENGADGLAFPPIIGFGEHSAVPHHSPTAKTLKKGDLVQFDIGCKKEGYCSDMSRVVSFGEVSEQLVQIESIVMEAKFAAEKAAFPGTTIRDFDRAARSVIERHGFGEQFLHSLGHGVGLDIHEWPLIKQAKESDVLQEGMIITIEPGIYLAGIGGVRLEDTYLITKEGPVNLTQELPGC